MLSTSAIGTSRTELSALPDESRWSYRCFGKLHLTKGLFIKHDFPKSSQAERMAKGAQFGVVDEILSKNEKNYAILRSKITQLRVKLPRVLHRGSVTLTTAQGEKVFNSAQKATPMKALSSSKQIIPYVNPYPLIGNS